MKSKQVLSIDQMKHLRELGLDTSDASMHWQFLPTVESFFNGVLALEERPTLFVSQPNMKHEYPAYTLQDILDKLPSYITYNDIINGSTLKFEMGKKPDKNFGKASANRPIVLNK